MHWVFISCFRVAIRSLLEDWLLRSRTCFLMVGQTESSSAPRFCLASAGLFLDTNRKWVQFGMRGQQEVQRMWASAMHHYSVLQQNKCVQIMCNCVDRVCFFGYCFCVFSIDWWPSICNTTVSCVNIENDHNSAVCLMDVETRCVLKQSFQLLS